MFAVALIVLRETLEAALIVGIVLAASIGIPGRGRWVFGGVLGGVAGALALAAFAAAIAESFSGNGQELLNAAVLGLAVCMLAWHNIWMASHAREMTRNANAVGREIASGARPLMALALITGAAVLREGSETVLFLFGVAATSSESVGALVFGGLLGLAGGGLLGATLYFGLIRIPFRRLFAVMGILVLFLAAGLAAQSVSFLVQADFLPSLGENLWDTTFVLDEATLPGKIFHTLLGYVARPSGMQLLAWVGTVVAIGLPMRLIGRRPLAIAAALSASLVCVAHPTLAAHHISAPTNFVARATR